MLKKILDFLFGKRETAESNAYPFPAYLQEVLPYSFSFYRATEVARSLCDHLELSLTEVEIVLLLIGCEEPVPIDEIEDEIRHVTEAHVRRLVKGLCEYGILAMTFSCCDEPLYMVSEETMAKIKSHTY